jgi:hypothetical protein
VTCRMQSTVAIGREKWDYMVYLQSRNGQAAKTCVFAAFSLLR